MKEHIQTIADGQSGLSSEVKNRHESKSHTWLETPEYLEYFKTYS